MSYPAMKIVPAVLAENSADFLSLVRRSESFTEYIQIDLMDSLFVPTKSVPPEAVGSLQTSLSFEVHLMFRDPASAIDAIANPGLRKVIFHAESEANHRELLAALGGRGIEAGLAINPGTGLEAVAELAQAVHTLLFMTVEPGRYGSPFRRDVVEKVARARKVFGNKVIAVDGGVSTDNLHLFVDAGIDYACVGSRIFLEGNAAENYRTFTQRLNELEETKK